MQKQVKILQHISFFCIYKTIAAIGAGAISVISALTGGLVGAGVGGFFGSIAASNIDTSKGIYIKLKLKRMQPGIRSDRRKMGISVRVILWID